MFVALRVMTTNVGNSKRFLATLIFYWFTIHAKLNIFLLFSLSADSNLLFETENPVT